MTAPLIFCKDGFRLTACSQSRGTYVSLGVGAGGCLAMILNPAESDELEQLLAAARLNRQQPQGMDDSSGSGGAAQRRTAA